MKYVFVCDSNEINLYQAKNMSEAIKEATVHKIADYWNVEMPSMTIDFANFNTWLITWLKKTSFWDIPAIQKNIKKNSSDDITLKEKIIENMSLFSWDHCNKIYEISEERHIANDLSTIKNDIVAEAILKEISSIEEDNEKKEYARLKKKFETVN